MKTQEQIDYMVKKFVDQGRLIEAGWVAMRAAAIPQDAPEVQITEMRKAFFAGAQHLFASIMGALEAGTEPTSADLRRMDLINRELEAFVGSVKAEVGPVN